jgi:mevalonate kinase
LKDVPLDRALLFRAVSASERLFHGNPSGLDAHVVIEGGLIRFSKADGGREIPAEAPPLVVVSSGEPGDTGTTVASFARRLAAEAVQGPRRLAHMDELASGGLDAIVRGELVDLGRIMNENQRELRWFGVSTPALDGLCELALDSGALGAKLTGGGGGGCAIALTRPGDKTVAKAFVAAGFTVVFP